MDFNVDPIEYHPLWGVPVAPAPTPAPAIEVRTYAAGSQAASGRAFAADAGQYAANGYEVMSQAWEGSVLTVTYKLRERPTATVPIAARYQPESLPPSSTPAQVRGVQPAPIAVTAGGAMMAAGAFLPWITATGAFGVSMSAGGMDGGDGWLILACGIAVAIVGLTLMSQQSALWVAALVASIVGGIVGFIDYQDVSERISSAGEGIAAQVGIGLWLILAGAAVGGIASIGTGLRETPQRA